VHGPLWGSYGGAYYHDRDWHYAAQTLGNDLLAIDPHLLIVVEGIQMYWDPFENKLTGALWGSNLIGVQYDPIVLDRPGQLVYSVHEYGPKMWLGSWFSKKTTYHSLAIRWTKLWGYLLTAPESMQAPIFVGEVGTCDDWHSCISDPHKPWSQGFWWTSFVRYMKARPQVSWAYWSLNPEGPFRPQDNNFYSLMFHDWTHYHPRVIQGLGPLLAEPDGT
jgi:endoglucanase